MINIKYKLFICDYLLYTNIKFIQDKEFIPNHVTDYNILHIFKITWNFKRISLFL